MTARDIERRIENFVKAARAHYAATLAGDHEKVNAQAKSLQRAFQEIVALGDVGRDALLVKAENEEVAVAAMAAVYSLRHNTAKAIEILRHIAMQPGLIGFEAQQALQRWEEGSWQLE
jgi:carbamate kinase